MKILVTALYSHYCNGATARNVGCKILGATGRSVLQIALWVLDAKISCSTYVQGLGNSYFLSFLFVGVVEVSKKLL